VPVIARLECLYRTPEHYPDCPGLRFTYPDEILRVTDELGTTQLAAIYEDGLVGWELGAVCEDHELISAWREMRGSVSDCTPQVAHAA
jgi:hypothetical protein